MKTIQYAIDPETGLTWSRVGDKVAVPIYNYKTMSVVNQYADDYYLEQFYVMELAGVSTWRSLEWTKQIPKSLKNYHRQFWGMKELK